MFIRESRLSLHVLKQILLLTSLVENACLSFIHMTQYLAISPSDICNIHIQQNVRASRNVNGLIICAIIAQSCYRAKYIRDRLIINKTRIIRFLISCRSLLARILLLWTILLRDYVNDYYSNNHIAHWVTGRWCQPLKLPRWTISSSLSLFLY